MDTRSVLVPLDGSSTAEVVIPFAEAAAGAFGAELRLLTVLDTSHPPAAEECGSAEALQAAQNRAGDNLKRLAEQVRVRGLRISTAAVVGDPIEKIVGAAEQPDVVAVAMATQGQSGIKRWYLGGVADAVLRTTTKSVLLVNPDVTARNEGPAPLTRIVVPLDGSQLAEEALPTAEALATAGGVSITLVHVLPPAAADAQNGGTVAALEALDAARQKLGNAAIVTTLVLRGTPSAAIAEYLSATPEGFLVMTPHGRGGRKHLVLGSTAYRLLHAGPALLLVRVRSGFP